MDAMLRQSKRVVEWTLPKRDIGVRAREGRMVVQEGLDSVCAAKEKAGRDLRLAEVEGIRTYSRAISIR